ncbi:MAG TPA: DHA2 family efflux MFS transporter permease subunit [Ktedonobacteraceae bacterium]|nr:DHA2 family efflux MFS transporter permease subunit [Ktedonobacteraceae bacterium]
MYRRKLDPKVSVSIVFVAAMFMSIMDSTIVNVALPSLGRQLGVSNTSIDAVVVAYLVSLAVVMPASGWLGDRWGTRRVFLLALALFSVASALCGVAGNFPMLVVFRVLQGAAGGALTPVGTAILYRTFPPSQRVQVSRVLIIPTVLAPALGPVLGGFLVDSLSWRWVFYVNVPIGIAACLFGLIFLSEHRESTAGRFDFVGFLLAGIGLALAMYALSEGPSYGWASARILVSAIVGLLVLSAFVFIELRTPEPMIDLRLFANRLFRATNLVSLFASAGFLGALFVSPLFLQEARGVSALTSGLTTFPEAIGVVLSTQIVARLYPRIGPRRLMAAGLTGVAITMALLCLVGLDTNLWLMRTLMFLIGAGMAYAFLPLQAAAFATISHGDTGRASALYSAQRQLGAALGVAVLGSVLSIVGPVRLSATGTVVPNLTAYHAAFLAAAVLALIAASIALAVSDRDAAPTMQRRTRPAENEDMPEPVAGAEAHLQH